MGTNPLFNNSQWGWEGTVARRLREKYSDKVVLDTMKLPQLICNCYECIERYLDKSKGFNRVNNLPG